MKRTSQNLSVEKVTRLVKTSKKTSISAFKSSQNLSKYQKLHHQYPFTLSTHVVTNVVEQFLKKFQHLIQNIESANYYSQITRNISKLQKSLESSLCPEVDDVCELNKGQQQPSTKAPDQICNKQCVIEKRKVHKRAASNLTFMSKNSSHTKSSYIPSSPLKNIRNSIGLVPLDIKQVQSLTDLKTQNLRTIYREKSIKDISQCNDEQIPLPKLLMTKKAKKDKEQQYNYDYNGDKIPIAQGVIKKKAQINVLKLLYRVPKDRHEDVKNPKKQIQRIKHSKLPSVHSKKIISNGPQLYNIKSNIQKSFTNKYTKITSIEVNDEEK